MTEPKEEGYTSVSPLSSRHIKQLESLLERTEEKLNLERFYYINKIGQPYDYEECVSDIEALRYAIDIAKWLNGENE